MLLQFNAANYRSFRNEVSFSMTPAPKQKGLDYSVQSKHIGKKEYKALSSAVVFGPNAAGKTNIIGAMDTFRSIVLRGNIDNSDTSNTPNVASSVLEIIPFNGLSTVEPVKFSVKFIDKDILVEYYLEFVLGLFADRSYRRQVSFEELRINDKIVFARRFDDLALSTDSVDASFLNTHGDVSSSNLELIAKNSLSETELFLTNGFKSILSKKLFELVNGWFSRKFMIVYQPSSDSFKNIVPQESVIYANDSLNEVAKVFGIGSNTLGYKREKNDEKPVLCSLFEGDGKKFSIPSDSFESHGTVRFINEFPLITRALMTGATLVIDEFDASIHPMALMDIVNIFHNDEINKNHAQLIFNTHNPIFLSSSLFRRDEIKFVDRDDVSSESSHYSLSDFKTAGSDGVRKGEDYMKKYFISQYGAIKDVDFSPIIKNILFSKEDVARKETL